MNKSPKLQENTNKQEKIAKTVQDLKIEIGTKRKHKLKESWKWKNLGKQTGTTDTIITKHTDGSV